MLRAFDPFSSRADHLDCPHSHSLKTDEQMGLLAVWQSLRYPMLPAWWPSSPGACHGVPLWQAGLAFAALVYLGGLLHALGWFGPSLWRSSSDLGPKPCTITWWREVTLMASLGAGVALVSPVGDWHASMARGDAPSCCSPPILC